MKVLTSDGRIVEGDPISEQHAIQRDELEKLLHQQCCEFQVADSRLCTITAPGYPQCRRAADAILRSYALAPIILEEEAHGKVFIPKDPPPSWLTTPLKPAARKE